MRDYPSIGESGPLSHHGLECMACSKQATHRVRVQFDYMRGNDEVYVCCARHRRIAGEKLGRFLRHVETKAVFVGQKEKENAGN